MNDFVLRAGLIYEKIAREQPDVIAFQEIREPIYKLLVKMLPEYAFFGSMREKDYTGEGLYTAIRKDKCSFLATEVFWLSPTPFVPGSRFAEQSKYPRICVMTKIREHQTNRVFRVLNIHLDHISDSARRLGIECVFSFLDAYEQREKLPTVLLGDFNAEPQDGVIETCRGYEGIFDATAEIPVTFHGYGRTAMKIDYIFVSEMWRAKVQAAEAWQEIHEGVYLSDHYPVCLHIGEEEPCANDAENGVAAGK